MKSEKKMLQEVLGAQPCEKAVSGECKCISKNCFNQLPMLPELNCLPGRRWVLCYGWKKTLGLEFVKELGVYLPLKCPRCGADLAKELTEAWKRRKR